MMKKLFSLFCAIAIALCASAAPVAQKAQVANFNQLSATSALKVINQEAKAPQSEPVEITLVADTLNFFTKMLSSGYYIVRGYNVDSTYEFSFYFNSKSITGNFTEEDFYTYDTWVDEKDGKKIVVSYQNLSAANVTVSLVKDTLYYTGTMTLATNDGQEAIFTLNLSCPFKQPGMMYDSDAPFDATFAYEDMKSSISNGVISISATNAENFTIGLVLYADPTATTIPEGTYTISDSQEAGTALKSLGVNGGYLTECFAGTRGASGINVPCWFMVEGTVTLSYDEYGKLKVVVDAKNSYKQPVTALVQYSASPTALPSLFGDGVKGNKFMQNGQLLIRKDGKNYNVLGGRVK